MENLATLSRILQSPEIYPWDEAVYLPKDNEWALTSSCAVWNPDDCDEGDQPEIAKLNGLTYALGVSAIQDIVANARQQKPDCNLDDLLKAFLFYYQNDAYITFK